MPDYYTPNCRRAEGFIDPDVSNYPTCLPLAEFETWYIFKRSHTDLDSWFSFSKSGFLAGTKEPNLHNNLPIAGVKTSGFRSFPRVIVQNDSQTVLSRIWTRVVDSISYDDNRYVKHSSGISVKEENCDVLNIFMQKDAKSVIHFGTCS